ncbi:filamentous hemagglutinin N-terminal domain-containing protein, partial [Sphingomonas sp. 28-63-12]|uniref:two-partner secretion domain-containing protein n=1 Tax=Sphingomonas sp. 28-63-12 TaxID=1970434 RepID=UPI0035A92E94
MQVTQNSAKTVIDWRAFSIDAGSSVSFAQPNASAIALNRITGLDETRIDGSLLANGQVWLLNPNGVLIGGAGRVTAGGFLATTHALSNEDFVAGNYAFDGTGAHGAIVNFGQIVSATGGYAVLAGNKVGNAGLVQARLGAVALGAGKGFVLDLSGDKLLSFSVTQPLDVVPADGALVENIGSLSAAGGRVLLTARAAADVVGGVINTAGLIDATSVGMVNGQIVLDGGTVGTVAAGGMIDASGNAAGETGGAIKIFGRDIVVASGALVNARGDAGGGTINIGGGWQGAAVDGYANAVRTALLSGAALDASANTSGNGGTVTLWSDVNKPDSVTVAQGGIFAQGGALHGDGGRIETSGHNLVTQGAYGSASARFGSAGTWLFDPYNVEVVAAATGGNGPNIVNPGFEQGLTGWTTLGSGGTQVVTSVQASNGTTYTSQLSSGGNFALLTGGAANQNNGVSQTFTGTSGQSFSLYALFIGRDYLPYNDYGRVTLLQPNGSTLTLYSRDISQVGTNGTAPWESSTVNLSMTGSYTIQAYAANIIDGAGSPSLGFELGVASSSSSANGAFGSISGTQVWTPNGTASKIDVSQITGFLNAGTNVQITTGSAGTGSEAGNITVNAAIAKTSGATASLQLDAANAIVVNQAISSSSNALNVILNAGAGGITLGAGVNTNSGA